MSKKTPCPLCGRPMKSDADKCIVCHKEKRT